MSDMDLLVLLDELDACIDGELVSFFNDSSLRSLFSSLVKLSVLDNGSFSVDVLVGLDVLTDDLDSLDFGRVRDDISVLRDLL